MSVMPDGPVYDILLRGMATSEKDVPKKESELLLCNKPVVCWGGVAVGNAVQQKVILKHNGSPPSKRLRLQLSVQHPDFQLQNTFGKVDEKSMASIVNLAPQ
ncbi:uncharacterized protein LOC110235088, partial [Exaiptasia diaphana]|uniref:Cep192/Spd-2-like domain-containing protein n=1 Tax=Exaiptasia diaphana TaxID=2652724 RepID=A0A913WYN9_EXADI